jgi:hypothetical protein
MHLRPLSFAGTAVENPSGAGSLNVAHHGFPSLQGTTDLNGRIINCPDSVQDIRLVFRLEYRSRFVYPGELNRGGG